MAKFLESWGRALAERISVVAYEALFTGTNIPKRGASFIFADLDRLSPAAREVFGDFHDQVVTECGRGKVLNDPRRSLLRFDLLKALRQRGINRFDAWRVADSTEGSAPARFPVFLRDERGFLEQAPHLLHDEAAYRAAIAELHTSAEPIEHQIAVEFCETADERGVYHKYGAFAVGDTIVPRHLFFSRNWLVKDAEIGEAQMLAAELAFLDANPHVRALREIFRTAGIGYGRIDYSVVGGRIQVWEINTNPVLTPQFDRIPERRAVHERFVRMISAAFVALDQRKR
jgi:hypothetical protein